MFHSERFLKQIDSTPGCRYKAFNTGHWVMHKEPDQVAEEIKNFVSKSE
jgi:pimeloyl-ACP methyl ester carboxylesterase